METNQIQMLTETFEGHAQVMPQSSSTTNSGIRPPFQGLNLLGYGTQGVALTQGVTLGYHSARLWRYETHVYEEIV
jgi:hypothetical protein